jgi:hypothetical protein
VNIQGILRSLEINAFCEPTLKKTFFKDAKKTKVGDCLESFHLPKINIRDKH